jgi:hypothetical protein
MATSKKQTPMASDKLLEHVKICTGWNNHLTLMYLAIKETTGNIVETGLGGGSTTQLTEYATASNRKLISYETSREYADQFNHTINEFHEIKLIGEGDWNVCRAENEDCSVILIDHSPGHLRKETCRMFADTNAILVLHDAQPKPNAGDYQFETIYPLFKYKVRFQPPYDSLNGDYPAGAVALSNHIDITKWIGTELNCKDFPTTKVTAIDQY